MAWPCGSRISAFGMTCTTTFATAVTLPVARTHPEGDTI